MENREAQGNSYYTVIGSSKWLKAMPFEHVLRNIPHDFFIRRLIQERRLYHNPDPDRKTLLTIVIYSNSDDKSFLRTLESCLLQSGLGFNVWVIAPMRELRSRLMQLTYERLRETAFLEKSFRDRIVFGESFEKAPATEDSLGEFVTCVRSGDVFHPSFATSLHLELLNSPPATVCLWNEMIVEFRRSPRVTKLTRKSQFEPFTLFHFNYISYNFAFRKHFLRSYRGLGSCFETNDAHLFLLSLIGRIENSFVTIPQYLLLKDSIHVHENTELAPAARDSYEKFFRMKGFTLQWAGDSSCYRLVPEVRPVTVTVVIPFRDRPEVTCQAVRSVLMQDVDFSLEIILVNNQSNATSVEKVSRFIEKNVSNRWSIRILDYDLPFNHSAECNLAAKEATGECLVFLNNDACLVSLQALREMACWSLVPGIGTVGLRIVDAHGRLVSAGIATELRLKDDRVAIVYESTNTAFAHKNREVWGNSFACAAISKKNFDLVGPLDEINFPIGYNDADYNMRCRRAGLRNMYLGSLIAIHTPAGSRGASDELPQILMLRRKYPDLFREALFQLDAEIPAEPNRIPRIKKLLKAYQYRLSRQLRTFIEGH
jgi:GT2 family glycosyltransferase